MDNPRKWPGWRSSQALAQLPRCRGGLSPSRSVFSVWSLWLYVCCIEVGGEEALLGRGSWSLEGLFYGDTDKLPEKLSQAFFQRNTRLRDRSGKLEKKHHWWKLLLSRRHGDYGPSSDSEQDGVTAVQLAASHPVSRQRGESSLELCSLPHFEELLHHTSPAVFPFLLKILLFFYSS